MRLQKHTVAIHIFMIVLISLVGIGIRMSTWQRTLLTITTTDHRPLTTNHHRILLGFDPYYHLRRGDLAAAGLPIPRIDYYSAYPFGAQSHWPKPFDIYLSLFLRAGRRVIPSASPESAAGFAPVVLAILSLWAAAPLFRRTERRLLWLTAAILAVLPAHTRFGSYGYCDHHVMEMLLTALTVSMFTTMDRNRFRPIITGALLAACQLSWRGALLVQAVAIGAMFWTILLHGNREFRIKWSRAAYCSFGTASLLYTAGGAVSQGTAFFTVDFYALSLFQLTPMLSAGVVSWIQNARLTGRRDRVIAGTLAGACIPIAAFASAGTWYRGFHFLIGNDPWRETITESVSLLSAPGLPPFPFAAELFSGLIYLVPILLWFLFRDIRTGTAPVRSIIVITWLTLFTLLMLRQQRYAHQASIPFAAGIVLAGPAIVAAVRRLSVLTRGTVIVFLCLSAVPPIHLQMFTFRTGNNLLTRINAPRYRALQWLRGTTPVPGDFHAPETKPAYGIMNPWDMGHWITWISRRAPVANNHGTEPGGHREGMLASCRFYSTTNAAEARSILEDTRARYVLTESNWLKLAGFAHVTGQLAEMTAGTASEIVSMRLHSFDGSDTFLPVKDGARFPVTGLDHYRLVYESPETEVLAAWSVPSVIKIFESVPGARLAVPPDATPPLMLTANVISNTGRTFKWNRVHHTAQDFIICPYATGLNGTSTRVEGPVYLRWADGMAVYRVPETAVLNGETVILNPHNSQTQAPP